MSESFTSGPYSGIIPSYPYAQYAWDENVQAFFASLNVIQQGYLTWFYETPLAVYTNSNISGNLLDWTATGIYGIARPVLTTSSVTTGGPLGTNTLGTQILGEYDIISSGSSMPVSDDIYKRTMTWILYRGDGLQFSMPWLLRRVERFLNGAYGSDVPIDQATRPVIEVSGTAFSILVPASNPNSVIFQQLMSEGFLPTPLPYTFSVSLVAFASASLAGSGKLSALVKFANASLSGAGGLHASAT